MFSIVIPSYNNINYLKICLNSIKKNSKLVNEIIIHVNEGTDGTYDFVKNNNLKHSYSSQNIGLCSATNAASKLSLYNYILYSHDDMYFCPGWDITLKEEVDKINDKFFYLSGTMIEVNSGHLQLDCGNDFNNFNETKLLNNFLKLKFFNHQGSHWAPHLIHKDIWNKIGGFSEEFNPGIGSDPDLNMKLWKEGVRIFKGLNSFRVYHFGSTVLRKKKSLKANKGARTFLKKWGITPIFFTKFYLRGGTFQDNKIKCSEYDGELKEPHKGINFYINLFICKIKLIYILLLGK